MEAGVKTFAVANNLLDTDVLGTMAFNVVVEVVPIIVTFDGSVMSYNRALPGGFWISM
jgi:hypothetical protein